MNKTLHSTYDDNLRDRTVKLKLSTKLYVKILQKSNLAVLCVCVILA